jgi:crotonobetainyl-CoA:carnitine CoA-transferase CaiB-like acyl-CoA transferase
VASPLRLSQTPVQYRHAPPLLGQDTRDVLADLIGMAPEAIAELMQQGVVE